MFKISLPDLNFVQSCSHEVKPRCNFSSCSSTFSSSLIQGGAVDEDVKLEGSECFDRACVTIVEAFVDEGYPCLGDERFEIAPALATENAAHLKDIHEITVVGDLDDEMRLLAMKVLDLKNVMKTLTLQDLLPMYEDCIDRYIQALARYAAFHC